MMKWLFATLVIVNLVVFLWPAGDKAPFFDSRVAASAPPVNESSMLLLTETDLDQSSQPANAPEPVSPATRTQTASEPRRVAAAPSVNAADAEPTDSAESAPAPAVTPIAMPTMTMSKPSKTANAGGAPVPVKPVAASRNKTTPSAEATPRSEATKSDGDASGVAGKNRPEKKNAQEKGAPARVAKTGSAKKTDVADAKKDSSSVKDGDADSGKRKSTMASAGKASTGTKPVDKNQPSKKIARAAPVPAPKAGACLRFGPFQTEKAVGDLAAELNERETPFRNRFVDAREVRTWRVFVGPLTSNDQVAAIESELSAAGVTDRYIAAEQDGSRIVSLGVFSASKSAESVKVLLARKTIDAQVRPEMRKLRASRWIEIASPGLDEAGAAVFASRPLGEKRARARRIQCSPAAG